MPNTTSHTTTSAVLLRTQEFRPVAHAVFPLQPRSWLRMPLGLGLPLNMWSAELTNETISHLVIYKVLMWHFTLIKTSNITTKLLLYVIPLSHPVIVSSLLLLMEMFNFRIVILNFRVHRVQQINKMFWRTIILQGQYLNIFSNSRNYFYNVIHGHNFFKNSEATLKVLPPDAWHEARSKLRTHKHWRRRTKFIPPERIDARDLCILEKYTPKITQN